MKSIFLVTTLLIITPSLNALEHLQFSSAYIKKQSDEVFHFAADDLRAVTGPITFENPSPEIEINLGTNSISAHIDETQLIYEHGGAGAFSQIKGVESEQFQVAYTEKQHLSLSAQYLTLGLGDSIINLPQFSLRCDKNHTQQKFVDLSICLEVAKFEAPILDLDSLTLDKIKSVLPQMKGLNKGIEKLENIHLSIFNRELYMTFKARFLFKWKIKVKGNVSIDSERSELHIKIRSAKASFLSIKKTILKQLAQANISNLSVKGDTLVIAL